MTTDMLTNHFLTACAAVLLASHALGVSLKYPAKQ